MWKSASDRGPGNLSVVALPVHPDGWETGWRLLGSSFREASNGPRVYTSVLPSELRGAGPRHPSDKGADDVVVLAMEAR